MQNSIKIIQQNNQVWKLIVWKTTAAFLLNTFSKNHDLYWIDIQKVSAAKCFYFTFDCQKYSYPYAAFGPIFNTNLVWCHKLEFNNINSTFKINEKSLL